MKHIRFRATAISVTGEKTTTVVLSQEYPKPVDDRDRNPHLTFYSVPIQDAPIIGQVFRLSPVEDTTEYTTHRPKGD